VHAADRADDVVGRLVVLEDPAQLGGLLAQPFAVLAELVDRHHGEPGAHQRVVAVLLLHPHQRHAGAGDAGDLEPPQQLDQLERPELAAEILDRLVEVGERHDEGHRLVVDLHEHRQIGHDHWPERLGRMVDLGLGEGHEAPVVAPGVIEDADQGADLGVEHLHVGGPHLDPPGHPGARHQLLADRLRRVLDVVVVREQVLDLGVAARLDPAAGIGRVVGHQQHRGAVEAPDHQPDLLVDRQAERTGDPLHALGAQPVLGRLEQGGEDRRIVLGDQAAEMAGVVVVALEIGAIDLRRDPPDHLAGAASEEELHLDMPKQRVLLRREGLVALDVEVRDVTLVAAVQPHRQLDEGLEVRLALDRRDGDVRAALHVSSGPSRFRRADRR
jgi:hypothetical protein